MLAATISAAPELRDLKKEATAFVPATLKRKKAGTAGTSSGTTSKLNAAPEMADLETVESTARPDIVSALKDKFGPVPAARGDKLGGQSGGKGKGDYEKFVDELGDILGPSSKKRRESQ
jgi:hypothetical protein